MNNDNSLAKLRILGPKMYISPGDKVCVVYELDGREYLEFGYIFMLPESYGSPEHEGIIHTYGSEYGDSWNHIKELFFNNAVKEVRFIS